MGTFRVAISLSPSLPDSRGALRRTLRLGVPFSAGDIWADAYVQDLSETGLKLSTSVALEIGETINLELTGSGAIEAKIVWQRESTFGCEFVTPIAKSVVSAALLRADAVGTRDGRDAQFRDWPVGFDQSASDLIDWQAEFESSEAAKGYRVIGFRQSPDGMVIAIVARLDGE